MNAAVRQLTVSEAIRDIDNLPDTFLLEEDFVGAPLIHPQILLHRIDALLLRLRGMGYDVDVRGYPEIMLLRVSCSRSVSPTNEQRS